MTENEYEKQCTKETSIMIIAFLISTICLCILTSYTTRLSMEQDLKRGELRLFDNQYSCQMTGKYIYDERFIPTEITIDKLPKDIQQKLKEM